MEMTAFGFLQRPALRALLRQRRIYRWAWRTVIALVVVAILADVLAGSKPLYCHYQGQHHAPVLESWFARKGWINWPEEFHRNTWKDLSFSSAMFPPIPYSPGDLDLPDGQGLGPFSVQPDKSWRNRHWLGTDRLGRDVLAGMIHGTRSALLVGLLGTGLALMIGLWLGGLSGYYGDDRLRAGWVVWLLATLGVILGVFYSIQAYAAMIRAAWAPVPAVVVALTVGLGIPWLFIRLGRWMDRRAGTPRRRVPLDLMIMRGVEAVQSLPGMLLLLALIPLFHSPSIWNIVLIVGLIRWPGFARFVRGEFLKIREMPYLEAAQLAGIPHQRILWRHAMPNAIPPILVVAAFGISSGVLIEAFLSFLGLGVPADSVTWGTLLNQARDQFSAWWLAVFPGLGIFLTVTAFNLLGEAVQESLDERKPYLPARLKRSGTG